MTGEEQFHAELTASARKDVTGLPDEALAALDREMALLEAATDLTQKAIDTMLGPSSSTNQLDPRSRSHSFGPADQGTLWYWIDQPGRTVW